MLSSFFSTQGLAASLLILSGLIFCAGGTLYAGREIWKWPSAAGLQYLVLERSLVITALVMLAVGIVLLARLLEAAGSATLAPTGSTLFFTGAVLCLTAETYFLSTRTWLKAPIVVYVFLAFLAQIVIGVALLQTGLVRPWVGWATIVWNLAWMVILPIVSRNDLYYPVLHHAAPLLIGIALLWMR
jgi:hypothetical protein